MAKRTINRFVAEHLRIPLHPRYCVKCRVSLKTLSDSFRNKSESLQLKALRSHVASDRGVFFMRRQNNRCLIPLLANNLRLLDNLWASLLLPPARHRCPQDLAACSLFSAELSAVSTVAAPEVMVWLVADVSVLWLESGSVDSRA